MDRESEENRKEEQSEPGGEGKEDNVCEAGCWERGGDV